VRQDCLSILLGGIWDLPYKAAEILPHSEGGMDRPKRMGRLQLAKSWSVTAELDRAAKLKVRSNPMEEPSGGQNDRDTIRSADHLQLGDNTAGLACCRGS
jgi:hypothetical protein